MKKKINEKTIEKITKFLNNFDAKLFYPDYNDFSYVSIKFDVFEKIMNEFERLNSKIRNSRYKKLKSQINQLELEISNLMLQIDVFEERLRVRDKRYDELRKKYNENEFSKIGKSEENG